MIGLLIPVSTHPVCLSIFLTHSPFPSLHPFTSQPLSSLFTSIDSLFRPFTPSPLLDPVFTSPISSFSTYCLGPVISSGVHPPSHIHLIHPHPILPYFIKPLNHTVVAWSLLVIYKLMQIQKTWGHVVRSRGCFLGFRAKYNAAAIYNVQCAVYLVASMLTFCFNCSFFSLSSAFKKCKF